MRGHGQFLTALAGCALVVGATACGSGSTPAPGTAAAPATGPGGELTDFARLEDVRSARFSHPTQVTNTWFPLVVGQQQTSEGSSTDPEEGTVQKRFVQTVTDLTKTVQGVRTVVAWDQDFENGVLKESELAFYGQADNGDLWYFGEYPEEYENGRISSTLSWIPGIAGAQAGIAIKGEPALGSPSYSEGWSPVVPWTDRARTAKVGQRDCVPAGCFDDTLVVDEFNREEPGAVQQKYYARGIGNTRTSSVGTDQEVLQLVKVSQLDTTGLAAARTEALKLEASAIQHSRDVYAQSSPIEKPPGL